LAWNQSVTRTRWLAVKLGLVGVASMATAGLFSLMVTWWAAPIDKVVMNRITPELFPARGIAPIGYAAFAFALGVAAGVLVRRTVPAMAVTLAIFALIQVVMPVWVRPYPITRCAPSRRSTPPPCSGSRCSTMTIFLALALLVTAFCFWWIRPRRRS